MKNFFSSSSSLIIGFFPFVAAIGLPFLLEHVCIYANKPDIVWVQYIIGMFIYSVCWSALMLLEKIKPSFIAILGANIGLFLFISVVVLAFMKVTWWIILLCIPFNWLIGGYVAGLSVRIIKWDWLYELIAVFSLSLMYHSYYI